MGRVNQRRLGRIQGQLDDIAILLHNYGDDGWTKLHEAIVEALTATIRAQEAVTEAIRILNEGE